MAEYLHGAYGRIQAIGTKVAIKSRNAIVYVGTAPVHTVPAGAANVNRPILVTSIAEARKYFGYSEDWAKYTLCEAMHVHLEQKGVAPLVLINVLNPAVHKQTEGGTASLTPKNGRVTITDAEGIILDSVAVTGKTKGTDYTVQYDFTRKTITIAEIEAGGLGSTALSITYNNIDTTAVDEDVVIGTTDGAGENTGLHVIKNVYQETGFIPSFLLAPGFSSLPDVHTAMIANSRKVNNHWDVYVMADIPIVDKNAQKVTLASAATWKETNGYNNPNETVYFPLAKGTDVKTYHLSVLAAANFQELLVEQDGIPYKTASNTECAIIQNLFLGADEAGRVIDDTLINDELNKNGIASAAYVGGRWAIWGCHSADYSYSGGDKINVSETNRMMLYYLSNDFQHRRIRDVDKPLTANDIRMIVAEEQTRLDALVKIGALTYGEVSLNAEADARSDIMNGDYAFTFNVTTTPLAKSLTAVVNWTDEGFVTYFADIG
jgi:phage tail sheath protein FI